MIDIRRWDLGWVDGEYMDGFCMNMWLQSVFDFAWLMSTLGTSKIQRKFCWNFTKNNVKLT
jgi:hypothetical protein